MDEADAEPAGDQFSLAFGHRFEQRQIGLVMPGELRVVALDGKVGQLLDPFRPVMRSEKLEGANPQMAGRDTGQNRAR